MARILPCPRVLRTPGSPPGRAPVGPWPDYLQLGGQRYQGGLVRPAGGNQAMGRPAPVRVVTPASAERAGTAGCAPVGPWPDYLQLGGQRYQGGLVRRPAGEHDT